MYNGVICGVFYFGGVVVAHVRRCCGSELECSRTTDIVIVWVADGSDGKAGMIGKKPRHGHERLAIAAGEDKINVTET